MEGFFIGGRANDQVYARLRDLQPDSWPRDRDAVALLEYLWKVAGPYVDRDVRYRARDALHQAFFELYLTAGLLAAGVSLASNRPKAGPDLLIPAASSRPPIHVEAIAPLPGVGKDRVTEGVEGVVRDVPDDAIKLRLLNALGEKKKVYIRYVESRRILGSDPFVVAINGAAIPSAMLELPVPRMVSVLLGLGRPVVSIDRNTGLAKDAGYTRQESVEKRSGRSVPSAAFSDPTMAGISAVIYGGADAFNAPSSIGRDLYFIRNPNAASPLPAGVLGTLAEWRMDGDCLVFKTGGAAGA